MPGTLNVGGHDIITHTGTAGAGDVTVNVQDRLVLNSSGNVGVGTNNPRKKLEIDGALLLSNGGYNGNGDVILSFSTISGSGGSNISRNAQMSPSYIGLLFAYEIGQNKSFLAFVHKKDDTTTAPQVTTLASNGLSLGATNSGGTITVSGYTTAGNVRMKMIHLGDI